MKKILVGIDLSKVGQDVVNYGYSLAQRFGVEVTFLHVLPQHQLWRGYEPWFPPDFDAEVRNIAEKKIAEFLKNAETHLGKENPPNYKVVILDGEPGETIINYAKENNFDLIVVGYRGYSKLERLIIGSTAAKIVRYAPCSVLVYRPGYEVL